MDEDDGGDTNNQARLNHCCNKLQSQSPAGMNFRVRVLATVSGALYNTVDNKYGAQKDYGATTFET